MPGRTGGLAGQVLSGFAGSDVNGHLELPGGGHKKCPWWPRDLPGRGLLTLRSKRCPTRSQPPSPRPLTLTAVPQPRLIASAPPPGANSGTVPASPNCAAAMGAAASPSMTLISCCAPLPSAWSRLEYVYYDAVVPDSWPPMESVTVLLRDER